MTKLMVFEKNGNLWTDSRDVAAMVDKQHKNLLADIRGYISAMEKMGELKIQPSDFFIESTYTNEQNKELPCFLISKKGCEFIANKLTGEKGVQFTAVYVTGFNDMEQHIKGEKAKLNTPYHYPPKASSAGEVAGLISAVDKPMIAQKSPGWKRAAEAEQLLKHFGIPVIDNFVEQPPYQLTFETTMTTTTLQLPPLHV